jgi:hypothetical protein
LIYSLKKDKELIRKVRKLEREVKKIYKQINNNVCFNDKHLLVEVIEKTNYFINCMFGYLDKIGIPSKLFCENLKGLITEYICENSFNLTKKDEDKESKTVYVHINKNEIKKEEQEIIELMGNLLNINICEDKNDITYYSKLQTKYRENYNKIRGLMTKYVFTKTDKTNKLCICNRNWYYGELRGHLNKYFTECIINDNDKVFENYPYIYLVIKDHKDPLETRMIVSYNTEKDDFSRELSNLSDKYFKKVLEAMKTEKGIKIIKDSFDIYEIMNNEIKYGENDIIKTGDIKQMYNNLEHKDILKYSVSYGKKLGLIINKDLVQKILDNCLVKVKGKIYRQKKGVPMGNPISPILSMLTVNGYIDTIENHNVEGLLYVDDILCKGLEYDINSLWNKICNGLKIQIEDTKIETKQKYCMMEWDDDSKKMYYEIRKQRKKTHFLPDINNYFNTRNQIPISIFKGYENLIKKLNPYNWKIENDLNYLQFRIITDLQYENLCLAYYRKNFTRKYEELLTTLGIVKTLNRDLITHFENTENIQKEKISNLMNKLSKTLMRLIGINNR